MNASDDSLRALAEASRELAEQVSPAAFLERVVCLAVRLLRAPQGALYLNDNSTAWSVFKTAGPGAAESIGSTLLDVPSAGSPPRYSEKIDSSVEATRQHALISAPLQSGWKVYGAIVLRRAAPATPFTAREADLLEILAQQAALKLDANPLEIRRTASWLPQDAMDALIAAIAHEVHAPLRHIQCFVGKLQQRLSGSPDAAAARELRIIGDSAGSLLRLSDALYAFVKLQVSVPAPAVVDCEALAADLIAAMRSRDDGSPDIEWHLGPIAPAYCDPTLLRVALCELLHNAVKFTRARLPARIEVGSCASSADRVTVYVCDNGVGFDPIYGHKLFEPFQRLHSAKEYAGVGLGLATVRSIATRLGGSVRAEGRPGKGATVYLSLPRAYPTWTDHH